VLYHIPAPWTVILSPRRSSSRFQPKGDSWTVQRVWTQHVGGSVWAAGSNGTIDSCRINTSWGDGINLNLGVGNQAGTISS